MESNQQGNLFQQIPQLPSAWSQEQFNCFLEFYKCPNCIIQQLMVKQITTYDIINGTLESFQQQFPFEISNYLMQIQQILISQEIYAGQRLRETKKNVDSTSLKSLNALYLQELSEQDIEGTILKCPQSSFNIGSNQIYNQVIMNYEKISPKHAQISYMEGNYYIKDLGSTTGTYLRIDNTKIIQINDIYEFGKHQMYIANIKKLGEFNFQLLGTIQEQKFMIQFQRPSNLSYTFGRGANNAIQFKEDEECSSQHMKITLNQNQQIIIEDLKSRNGTWLRLSLKNQESKDFQLANSSQIKFGEDIHFVAYINKQPLEEEIKKQCLYCNKNLDSIIYPCMHALFCKECCGCLKKCLVCKMEFTKIMKFQRINMN